MYKSSAWFLAVLVSGYVCMHVSADELSPDAIDVKSPKPKADFNRNDPAEISFEAVLTIDKTRPKPAIVVVEIVSATNMKNVSTSKGVEIRDYDVTNNQIKVFEKLQLPRDAGQYRLRVRVLCDQHEGALKAKPKYVEISVK